MNALRDQQPEFDASSPQQDQSWSMQPGLVEDVEHGGLAFIGMD